MKPSSRRIEFFVGDVHGCHESLLVLEQKCREQAIQSGYSESDVLFVYLGDLIDRGAKVREVVRHLRSGTAKGSHICIAGNHESIFLSFIDFFCRTPDRELVSASRSFTPIAEEIRISPRGIGVDALEYADNLFNSWFAQGGGTTLKSFGLSERPETWEFPDPETQADILYLASLPLAYGSEMACATHALADPHEFALAMASDELARNGKLDEAKASLAGPEGAKAKHGLLWSRESRNPWPQTLAVHLSGHTPLDEPAWLDEGRRLQVDTGCVYGNHLTAWSPQLAAFVTAPGPGHNLANYRFL